MNNTSYGVFLLVLLIRFIIFFLVFEAYGISVTLHNVPREATNNHGHTYPPYLPLYTSMRLFMTTISPSLPLPHTTVCSGLHMAAAILIHMPLPFFQHHIKTHIFRTLITLPLPHSIFHPHTPLLIHISSLIIHQLYFLIIG